MDNPGAKITIELQALTDGANAKLGAFFKSLAAQTTAANVTAASVAAQVPAAWAAAFGKAAQQTNTHIAGMSYYFRSAIDGIRAVAAGGGPRAWFYTIDEAVRGLLGSGLALSTIIPIIAGLAAAVGGGALVWLEYSSASREAEKATKDLHDRLKATAELLVQMRELQKAGLLSPEAEQRNRDILSGKIKVYKDSTTGVLGTPNYIEQDANKPAPKLTQSKDSIIPMAGPLSALLPHLKALEGGELAKYVQDKISVPGGIDPEQTKAKAQLEQQRAEIHAKSISDTDLEIQKIHEKYEAERAEIKNTATMAGSLMTPEQQAQNDKAIAESTANEEVEIARKRQEAINKVTEQISRAREEFARTENEKLDANLNESAARQGKTRGEIYQEEYDKRVGLLSLLRLFEVLNEQQYTDALKAEQAKRLVGIDQEEQRLDEIGALKEKLSQKDFDYQRKQIEQNPFLSAGQKSAGLLDINSQQSDAAAQALQANQSALATEQDPQKQIQLLGQEKELLGQLNGLYLERQKLAEDAPGFLNQWSAALSKLNGEWRDLGTNAAKQAINIMQDGLSAVSQSITSMIFGAKNWGEAFAQSARKAVSGIIQMATQYVASKAAMAAVDAAFTAKSKANAATTVATSGTAGIAQAGAQGGWVGVLIYMGVFLAAMAAMEAIAAGISGGFKEGGFTGSGDPNEVAGMVHRGEFVIPAARVRQFGGGFFESIRNGSLSAGSVASSSGSPASGGGNAGSPTLVNVEHHHSIAILDSDAAARKWAESQEGRTWFVSMLDRNISQFQR